MPTVVRARRTVVLMAGAAAALGATLGLSALAGVWQAARTEAPGSPGLGAWHAGIPWLPLVADHHPEFERQLRTEERALDPCWTPGRIGPPVDPPVAVGWPEPTAPERCSGGTVIVELVVDRSGAVRQPRVLRSVAGCDEAAIAAVSRWRYRPATWRGEPSGVGDCRVKPGDPFPVFLTVAVRVRGKEGAAGDVRAHH